MQYVVRTAVHIHDVFFSGFYGLENRLLQGSHKKVTDGTERSVDLAHRVQALPTKRDYRIQRIRLDGGLPPGTPCESNLSSFS